jgi:hypothetical protein
MAFIANEIGFSDGSSNVFPLAVVGGKVIATNFQADDIKAGTITTNKIVANNISQMTAGYYTNWGVTTGGGTILSMVINCSGGNVDVDFYGNASVNNANDVCLVGLNIDGVAQGSALGGPVQTWSSLNPIIGRIGVKPAAGSHTFSFVVWKQGSSSSMNMSYFAAYITDEKTQS